MNVFVTCGDAPSCVCRKRGGMWKDMAGEKLKDVLIKSQSRVFLFIFIKFLCHNSQCSLHAFILFHFLLTSCAVRMNFGFPLRIVAPSQMFLRPSPNSCLLSLPELLLFRLCNFDVLPFQQWAWSVLPIAFPPNQFLSVVLFCLAVSSWRWWTRNWSCTNVPLTLLARSHRCPRIVVLRLRSSAPFPVGLFQRNVSLPLVVRVPFAAPVPFKAPVALSVPSLGVDLPVPTPRVPVFSLPSPPPPPPSAPGSL